MNVKIQNIFASKSTWMDSVNCWLRNWQRENSCLQRFIWLGALVADLRQKLEDFHGQNDSLSRQPIIKTIQPHMVTSIVDPNLLKNVRYYAMALAYQAIELQNETTF
jgi:hypothetical protein